MNQSATSHGIVYACALTMAKEDGPALHVRAIVKNITRMGRSVSLLCSGPYALEGADVKDIGQASSGLFAGSRMRHLLAQAVEKELLRDNVKAVYVRGSFPEVSRVTRKFRVPCIVEYNGVLVDELKITKTPLWRRMLSQRREAIVANSCSAAIAVDESTREGMIRHYPVLRDKCATVLNGCDVDLFDAVRDVPKDPKRLIFVGSLFSWARLDIGLRAMALLPEDVTLDVIGDGERLSEYRKLSADLGLPNRVRFHGRLPHKDIPKWLSGAAAGLAIESAGFEGSMPLKVSEYLAAGCVLVANGYPCHRHLEALGHARLFPTPPTPEGVATAVIEALTPAALDDSAVRARRSYAREHLSWERAAREILAVIDKVAESGAL